jgi:hypothetical protein
MSEISIDDGAESNIFMSLPGSPANDGAFVRMGELVHDYLVFNNLSDLFLQRFPAPDHSHASAHMSETSSGPSTSRDIANGEGSCTKLL